MITDSPSFRSRPAHSASRTFASHRDPRSAAFRRLLAAGAFTAGAATGDGDPPLGTRWRLPFPVAIGPDRPCGRLPFGATTASADGGSQLAVMFAPTGRRDGSLALPAAVAGKVAS